jgi:hypothetical protein
VTRPCIIPPPGEDRAVELARVREDAAHVSIVTTRGHVTYCTFGGLRVEVLAMGPWRWPTWLVRVEGETVTAVVPREQSLHHAARLGVAAILMHAIVAEACS